jgi:hypothetical protein
VLLKTSWGGSQDFNCEAVWQLLKHLQHRQNTWFHSTKKKIATETMQIEGDDKESFLFPVSLHKSRQVHANDLFTICPILNAIV